MYKRQIETLTTVANDPANTDVVSLMIDGATFKDVVIKTETDLRSAREHIIGALSLLKIAVTSVATQ